MREITRRERVVTPTFNHARPNPRKPKPTSHNGRLLWPRVDFPLGHFGHDKIGQPLQSEKEEDCSNCGGQIQPGETERQSTEWLKQVARSGGNEFPYGAVTKEDVAGYKVQQKKCRKQILETKQYAKTNQKALVAEACEGMNAVDQPQISQERI